MFVLVFGRFYGRFQKSDKPMWLAAQRLEHTQGELTLDVFQAGKGIAPGGGAKVAADKRVKGRALQLVQVSA